MRAAKRRSSRRRSSRRLRRNDAPPVTVAAPSSKKKKLLVLGIGVVAVGGVAAYAMSASAAPPPPTGPTGPTVDPRIAKQAECAALQASLVTLRAQPTPDAATMVQLEGRISACLAEARTLGAEVDAATTQQAAADAVYAQMEGWFNEYKATSDHDPLKRNNTRQSILNAGAGLATTYTNAITQSTNPQMTKLIAQSVLRALNAAISRQLCFLGNERGCGTFGSNEDQPDAKAAQEQSRVITPLIAAYMQAVTKLGGPSQALLNADGQRFLDIILRPCTFQKTFIDGQFAHYRATEWSDALKRNNTRRDILAAGRDLTNSLQVVLTAATSFGSPVSLRAVGTLTIAAINSSIDRWLCFFTNGSGCGTFAVNEDQPDVKAAQELDLVTSPLMRLYASVARALVASGDMRAYEPLITAKLRICSTLKSFIDGQFAHYRATEWSDALRRNNTRMSMLATGASLATCLRDALAMAVAAGTPGGGLSGLGSAGLYGMGGYVSDGLGLATTPVTLRLAPITTTARTLAPAPARVDVPALVRPIAVLVASAIDAAIQRKICYLYDQSGCGRFGVNEDHGNDKAAQEQARVIAPLLVVAKAAVAADRSNAQAETPLTQALLREVTAATGVMNAQYGSLKATDYMDGLKRNNIRGSIVQAGQNMVAAFRNMRPTTPAGRKLARDAAMAALASSREREACYRAGAAGCGRLDDAGYAAAVFFSGGAYAAGGREDHGNDKANQELNEITNPLTVLSKDTSAAGLAGGLGDEGEILGMSRYAWGVALGVIGGAYALGMFDRKPVRNSKRRRRTSRRLSA
jgi:hypothetical protein